MKSDFQAAFGRREFLRFAGLAACVAPLRGLAYDPIPALNVRKVSIPLGVAEPFSILHVSDSHIARIDSRDGEATYAFAKLRSRIGRELGEYYLGEAIHHARARGIKIVHTGDFMDFVSVANIEHAARRIRTDGIVACVGNHEYWLDAGKKEVESYKEATIPKLKDEWKGVPASTVRLGGANFFVFDDSFGTVTETIAAAFEETVKEGLPIVMVCHVPLWTEGVGLNVDSSCGALGRNLCDAVSGEFVERVRREPLVRAVLAGHLHGFRQFAFSDHAQQLVAGALFNGDCTEIEFTK
ncbi:MAG: metallophosphoesterase [Kiritimatiellae bacterium]|nr:metallophosphoesterase [Kiritimatiellia bacterium]